MIFSQKCSKIILEPFRSLKEVINSLKALTDWKSKLVKFVKDKFVDIVKTGRVIDKFVDPC